MDSLWLSDLNILILLMFGMVWNLLVSWFLVMCDSLVWVSVDDFSEICMIGWVDGLMCCRMGLCIFCGRL